MLIFAIDDDPNARERLLAAIREAEPEGELCGYPLASDALTAAADRRPGVVFSGVEMGEMSGLELAARFKSVSPETKFVFVTAHPEHAVAAFKVRAHGYLLKPVTAADIREELDALPPAPPREPERLRVRCFGAFEAFYRGRPLEFSRQKSKELLAFLVKEQGAWCASSDIVATLWEDSENDQTAKNYLRVLTTDLRNTLTAAGIPEVLKKRRGLLAVNVERLDCDYYHLLAGDIQAVNAFQGSFMAQYSWAEVLNGALYFSYL